MKTRKILGTLLIAIVAGLIAVFAYAKLFPQKTKIITTQAQPVAFANYTSNGEPISSMDFTYAAEKTVEGVVHVKTQTSRQAYRNPLYEFFYGHPYKGEAEPILGFGSGVIISPEGYIVTNNHVIDKSDEISVVLNDNREFKAELIGTDPSTDIALLKIKADNVHFIPWGNSDDLRLGEWVLAVGNPYNLTSTVTAGIVSAKGRSLNIIQDQYRIESFIQTDAALNRGNSGGALVNIKGELVGINTAILSPSGAYSGNSFAVPVNIVKKIVEDLIEYGEVQRAILGVTIQEVDAELAKEQGIKELKGVYINGLKEDGAAKAAGVHVGDIVIDVNGIEVNSPAELQEQIGRYRPKEKVTISVIRDNKKKQIDVVLRNMHGDTGIVKSNDVISLLGATFENISDKEKNRLGIRYGVKVKEVNDGKLKTEGVKQGFIITQINNTPIYSPGDIKKVIEGVKGGVYIEGIYEDGVIAYYAFGL